MFLASSFSFKIPGAVPSASSAAADRFPVRDRPYALQVLQTVPCTKAQNLSTALSGVPSTLPGEAASGVLYPVLEFLVQERWGTTGAGPVYGSKHEGTWSISLRSKGWELDLFTLVFTLPW